jgi:hypothetical protein
MGLNDFLAKYEPPIARRVREIVGLVFPSGEFPNEEGFENSLELDSDPRSRLYGAVWRIRRENPRATKENKIMTYLGNIFYLPRSNSCC